MASPFVVVDGKLINAAEIAFAAEVPALAVEHAPPGYDTQAHLHIQFRHGFSLNVPGLTAEGLKSLLDGAPY